jgi:hypothetical protein
MADPTTRPLPGPAAAPDRAPAALAHQPPHLPFDQAAAIVLGDLQHALVDLLAAAPSEVRKAADVERVFGVNHLIGWQVYRIATAQNPLAAGAHVPARVSLKKLLTAAARRRVSADILSRISEAFDAFEHLVESDAGGREELEAMLSAYLPEENRKQELLSRESIFKGMSHVKGLAAEADVAAMFFHPNADGLFVDRVTINAEFGLRRIRPDAAIVLGSGDTKALDDPMRTLDGRPPGGPMGILLPQFSSTPFPLHEQLDSGNGMVDYCIRGQNVGMRSAVDIVTAERRDRALPRYRKPASPIFGGPAFTVTTPVKRMTLDAFIHEDVFPGTAPRLWIYDTTNRGFVYPIDSPARQRDQLPSSDPIRTLPAGLTGARLAHAPRYIEILEHVYSTLNWDPSRFRAYRLDVQFPVYGAQYQMGFRVPDEHKEPLA